MGRSFTRLLHWPVRFLALAHLLFIGLFALDVFDTGLGTWQTLLSLLIHLIPSLSIALALLLAWKHSLVGAIAFLLLSVLFPLFFLDPSDGIAFWVLIAPLPVCCMLFFLEWWYDFKTSGKNIHKREPKGHRGS